MTTQERFLHYITYDTQSDEDAALTPSTPKQKRLGARLAQELQEMGLEHAHLAENGAVYAWLPATAGKEDLPVLALIAHMDTAPRVPGENVKAQIVRYEGGDLVLNAERGIVMTPAGFPDLNDQVGKELIVTDGTTLLGADDKAGVAEIFSAVAYLAEHPELAHGRVAVCITPDEEVGRGADSIDLDLLGADFAYTVDGGPLGTLEYENFNAASAEVVIHGVNIHPGDAKNKMKNACLMAAELIAMVPPAESPAHTEGYEGFYHLCGMEGDESEAKLSWILRDHDWDSFEARKQTMQRIGDYLNGKYGPMSVEVRLTDSYYNMKEKILPHPELLDWARAFDNKPKHVFVTHGDDTVTEVFAQRLKEDLGYDATAPFSGTEYDLLENKCIHEAPGIRIVKATASPKASRAARAYEKLLAMGRRLMTVIRKNEGCPNKDLDRFARDIQSLCDKWDRDDI